MLRRASQAILSLAIFPLAVKASDLVLPPGASIPPTTLSQFTTEWWQWALSQPNSTNPVRDRTGAHCGAGQAGPVWFLAGGFGSSKIRRTCTVPAGKALFFPIINMVYLPPRQDSAYSCAEAKVDAALNNDTAINLFAELDGAPIQNVKQHRISSETCFDAYARIPAPYRPYNAYPSASDGYWLLLKPLKPGRHLLKFGGRYNNKSQQAGRMIQDIEYVLIVQ